MQIKLIVVGNVKEIFYQNKIDEFQKQINKKMSIHVHNGKPNSANSTRRQKSTT